MATKAEREARAASLQASEEQERRAKDLAKMQRPNDWPRWPVLPVVKRHDRSFAPDSAGLLIENKGVLEPVVYVVNLYAFYDGKMKLADAPQVRYLDFEALVAEWRVD